MTRHGIDDRLSALEQRVARLEHGHREPSTPAATAEPPEEPDLFLLASVEQRIPDSVAIVGSVPVAGAGQARWQQSRHVSGIEDLDWGERAGELAALGHPVRLRLLQLVAGGVHGTGALADSDGVGSVGQVQHHLRTLLAAGWLESSGRGQVSVPNSRLVPLLAVVLATVH